MKIGFAQEIITPPIGVDLAGYFHERLNVGMYDDLYVKSIVFEVNGKLFDVYSDDEALLKPNPVPNLYINDDLIIFGSVVFAKADEDGNLVGLSSKEVPLLWNFSLVQFPKLLAFIARQRRHF